MKKTIILSILLMCLSFFNNKVFATDTGIAEILQ